jgi:uncharacterized protein YndB with AHSA1/START domain
MTETTNAVSVTRRIAAPAAAIFAVLVDPARHPEIDGSGMVRAARTAGRITGVGDTFVMAMHNDEMGDYEMTNRVVAFEADGHIVWEPFLSAASRQEDASEVGSSARQRWGYELVPEGAELTVVTETFHCTDSPPWLQKAVRGGQRWLASMAVTLERLETAAAPAREP